MRLCDPTCGTPADTNPLGDLDLACAILDAARHAITEPGRRIDRTTQALFTEDAGRLVREWEARKKSRLDPTPTSVRVHEHARAGR